MSVESMYESLDGRLVKVTQIRRGLPGFLGQHHHVGVDQSECINHNLPVENMSYIIY